MEDRSKRIRTYEHARPSANDAADRTRADSVRGRGAGAVESVALLVAGGMSRLGAERAVAIKEGARPGRARRHGRSGW